MRAGDDASIEYMRSQLGLEQTERQLDEGKSTVDESYSVSEVELARLDVGEAFIVFVDGGWIRGEIHLLDELAHKF